MSTIIDGIHASLDGEIRTNAAGDQVMDIVCQQSCERCGREYTYTVMESTSGWDCWPHGWWMVWTGWHVPDDVRMRSDPNTWPILMVCPDCYRDEDDEGMSHAIQAGPEREDAHIVDCSEGQGPNGRIMWEHTIINGKQAVCR